MSNESFIASVAHVHDGYKVVLNKGFKDGVKINDVFIVYKIGDNILDPETGENLGALEIIRGVGKVTHVQETMSTIESSQKERSKVKHIRNKHRGLLSSVMNNSMYGDETVEEIDETIPFDDPHIGDKAKRV